MLHQNESNQKQKYFKGASDRNMSQDSTVSRLALNKRIYPNVKAAYQGMASIRKKLRVSGLAPPPPKISKYRKTATATAVQFLYLEILWGGQSGYFNFFLKTVWHLEILGGGASRDTLNFSENIYLLAKTCDF